MLDYAVPSTEDGERCLHTKANDPALAPIPVVVVSGYILPDIGGVVAQVSKPFGMERLLGVIHRFAGPPTERAEAA